MTRWTLLVMSAVAAVGALAMFLTLRTQQQAGPPHKDVVLPGSVPATLYLPVDAAEEPPPVVVVGHGYSADRVTMSWFARTVASSGYAVLTIDFRGHGANENPLEGDLADDVESALDWIASSPDVDPERVAVMGHSMGSHAVLHFASEDPRPDAVVALGSGVTQPSGSRRPPNLLLLLAAREPADLQEATDELLVQLAGPSAVAGRVYGDLEKRDAVQLLRIEGTDHVSVLWSGGLVNKTVAWLNSAFGAEEGESPITSDPRLGTIALYLLFIALLIPGVGWVVGSIAPVRRKYRTLPMWGALVAITSSLVIALLVLMIVPSLPFFIRGFGEVVVYLFVTGVVLLGVRVVIERARSGAGSAVLNVDITDRPSHLLAASAIGVALGGVLISPITVVFHRLVLSPQRIVQGGAMALLMIPFFILFQVILRQGPTIEAVMRSGVGHLVLVGALALAVMTGVVPGVVGLVLPLLVVVFVLVDVFGAAAYSRGGSAALVGVVESIWLAGLSAAVMPIS